MEALILIAVLVIGVGLYYLYRELKESKRISETRLQLACRDLGLKVYESWLESTKHSLQEYKLDKDVKFISPLVRWDNKTNECLLAAGYSRRDEDDMGWENEVVWEVIDLISGSIVDKWGYGTAVPGATASNGDRKNTEEKIQHYKSERKRGDEVLKKFYSYYTLRIDSSNDVE